MDERTIIIMMLYLLLGAMIGLLVGATLMAGETKTQVIYADPYYNPTYFYMNLTPKGEVQGVYTEKNNDYRQVKVFNPSLPFKQAIKTVNIT